MINSLMEKEFNKKRKKKISTSDFAKKRYNYKLKYRKNRFYMIYKRIDRKFHKKGFF